MKITTKMIMESTKKYIITNYNSTVFNICEYWGNSSSTIYMNPFSGVFYHKKIK